jgi:hypothetical protein
VGTNPPSCHYLHLIHIWNPLYAHRPPEGSEATANAFADLFFVSYPISFIDQRGWTLGVGGLPFLAVMAGVVMGGVVNFAFIRTRYVSIMKRHGRVPPEERLVPMMVGSIALPVGLFWYAWTSSPNISPIPQILSGVPVGMGMCSCKRCAWGVR